MNSLIIAVYEVRRLIRSRGVLMNLFLLPLVIIFLLGSALSGMFNTTELSGETVKVVVAAEQTEPALKMLETYVSNPEVAKRIRMEKAASRQEAEEMLRSGSADYAVLIPDGFGSAMQRGDEARVMLLPGKDRTLNRSAGLVLGSFVEEINYRQAAAIVMGPEAAAQPAFAPGEASTAEGPRSYVQAGQLGTGVNTYSASQYYAAAMLIMFLFYSGMAINTSLDLEKSGHTLQRLHSLPVTYSSVFTGKLLGNGFVAVIQALVIVGFSHFVYGVDWGSRLPLVLLIAGLVILVSMSLSVVLSLLFPNGATAKALLQVLIIAMTFLSGGFSPVPGEFMRQLSLFTVNHWAFQGLLRNMLAGELPGVMSSIVPLFWIAAACLLLMVIVYRKVGYRE
ncbi:ABC transporter permease [Paenibacillus chitinolyticus]|uniref:ABC transporter permease n=1 Tax=Paenibacillus chitinolyticus TaxID=79263 RepID=UPI00386A9E8E